MARLLLVLLFLGGNARRIDPLFAENLTLYHVNSLSDGVIPVNMDTSDLPGDIFFDLRSLVLPLECGPGGVNVSFDCTNKENIASDLVISKLIVEVDSRYGEYGRCNVCGEDGVDPLTQKKCEAGEYFCTCGGWEHSAECSKLRSRVGRENITDVFSSFARFVDWDEFLRSPYMVWANNVYLKTGGFWYSTFQEGECDDANDSDRCTWRVVEVAKVVTKKCADEAIFTRVEDADKTGCFRSCGGLSRNTSSACWIGCFFKTVLGPAGMLPLPDVSGGLPLEFLVGAWEAPFNSESRDRGGCPNINIDTTDLRNKAHQENVATVNNPTSRMNE